MSVTLEIPQKCMKKLFLLIVFFLLTVASNASAVWISTGMQFVVQNETYTVTHTMNFHTITIDDTYIIFNTTGFYITSGNPISIQLSYIHPNIVSAGNGIKVLEFYANTSGGSVLFRLSGLAVNCKYDVKRNGVTISSVSTNGTGYLSFTSSTWGSSQLFNLFQNGSGSSDTLPPAISSITLEHSSIIDTIVGYGWENISCTVTDNVAVQVVFLRVRFPDKTVSNISMKHKIGTPLYYVNITLTKFGNYSYSIWTCDTSGNSIRSSSFLYSKPPNWDINNDGICTVFDYVLISNRYGLTGIKGWIREDVDNDGKIDYFDLSLVASQYGNRW